MAVPPHPIRVPVWQVTKESYRSVFMHPIIFVRIAWLPTLLFFTVAGGLEPNPVRFERILSC